MYWRLSAVLFTMFAVLACGTNTDPNLLTQVVTDGGMVMTFDGGALPDGGRSGRDGGVRIDGGYTLPVDAGTIYPEAWRWGNDLPIGQLVHESAAAPSGRNRLVAELADAGLGHLPPLQPRYVTAFDRLENVTEVMESIHTQIGASVGRLRIPLVWTKWVSDTTWPIRMINLITTVQDQGWIVDLALLHNESYPESLHTSGSVTTSGWANPAAPGAFLSYVDSVLELLIDEGAVPDGTIIYLGVEPEAMLWNGYLSDSGKWDPGGRRAGHGLARALVNQRDAFIQAGARVRTAGFRPGILTNIRPLLRPTLSSDQELLQYLRTWWYADNLFLGECLTPMSDFSQNCAVRSNIRAVDVFGVSFYGGMWVANETVDFGLPGEVSIPLALPAESYEPNATLFQSVIQEARRRYAHLPNLDIVVGEIGFDSGRLHRSQEWLIDYKRVVYCLGVLHTTVHTVFQDTAEYSAGEHFFGIIEECGRDSQCTITEWGYDFMEEVGYAFSRASCSP